MQGCAFGRQTETGFISLQDADRPRRHPLRLPILHHISEFKSVLFRKHRGCWPQLPVPFILSACFPYVIYYCTFCWVHRSPLSRQSVTESCCSRFVRVTERLHWDCEPTSPRWPPGRSRQATQGDSWASRVCRTHRGCSAGKWRKASHGWDSFILIKLTIKLMWLQRC